MNAPDLIPLNIAKVADSFQKLAESGKVIVEYTEPVNGCVAVDIRTEFNSQGQACLSRSNVEALLVACKAPHKPSEYEQAKERITASLHVGIMAEEDWDGPSVKPGTLTNEQIAWLGSWLAGEGIK